MFTGRDWDVQASRQDKVINENNKMHANIIDTFLLSQNISVKPIYGGDKKDYVPFLIKLWSDFF